MTIHAKNTSIASNLKRRINSHNEHASSVRGCEEHQKIDAEREEVMKMSVKRFGEIAGKAALAGFALAVLTAAATPAKAAVVTWDLWVNYDLNTSGPRNWMTDHFVDSNPFGITTETAATGQVTFDTAGCGDFECGPVEDSSFDIHFEFEGTPVSFSTGDDHRYNPDTNEYVNVGLLGKGPVAKFFAGIFQGFDFNVKFEHNSTVENWALSLEPGVVELYDLTNTSNFPEWTVVRGTLCHNGFGEPGEDSVCYRGDPPIITPIPAALPLFASGLLAMGLGAWRRRRNV